MDPSTFRSTTGSIENDDVTATPSFTSSMQANSVPLKSQLSIDESVQTKSHSVASSLHRSVASSLHRSVSIRISEEEDSSTGKKQQGTKYSDHLNTKHLKF